MARSLRKLFASQDISFKYLVSTALAIAVIAGLGYLWFSSIQENHIMEQVKKQAVILYKQVVLTRQWAALHGSVLVPKTAGVRSNPFLEDPDVTSSDGKVYTKVTPSVMTKMLSDLASQSRFYSFKITNTELLNPDNAPDELEKEALEQFRHSRKEEVIKIEERNGKTMFRYVAPLYVDEGCLRCHMAQDYKLGQVGGCLSVFIPMDEARAAIRENKAILLGGGVTLAGSLVLVLFLAARALVFNRIREIRESVSQMSFSELDRKTNQPGDELKEIADFCYMLDDRLRNQHQELAKKIAEATHDLSETNTDLEAANKQLATLNRAKSDFFTDVSHELRTPLTSIKGAADILERKAACSDPIYLDIIKRNTDHLTKILIDFLDYSKIEGGQMELDLEDASLNAVAEDAMLSQQAVAQKKSVKLVLEASGEVTAEIDKKRIYQVLTNLLSNAIRFSPENGVVTVRLQSVDQSIQVSVEDQGPGIAKKYHEAVFEKFYQVAEPGKTKIHQGSSGIGLAICKGLVKAHRGDIWVQSQPGKGSRFVFTIPEQSPHGILSDTAR